MTQDLDAKQFQQAVADAIKGVLNVYREADALLRELQNALEGAFVPLVKRLVPRNRRQNPDSQYLPNYLATVFVPASTAETMMTPTMMMTTMTMTAASPRRSYSSSMLAPECSSHAWRSTARTRARIFRNSPFTL